MKINISNIIEIKDPTQEIIDYCKKDLTFTNPDYIKKQRMGFWMGKTPKIISLYDLYEDNVYVPIGCFEDLWKIHPIKEDYTDYTSSVPRNITSNMIMREYQQPCMDALKKYVNGIFLLPAGCGKTNIALECAAILKQHTIFLTHTKELLNQAKERCESTLNCTTSLITDGKCDLSGDIVFATVQTLVNFVEKEKIKQNEFGLVICDECHHASTNAESVKMFEKCINYFNARYKLGLTATLHRSDGLENTTTKILGNVIYELRKEKDKLVGYYENEPILSVPLEQFQTPARVYIKKTQYKPTDDCFDNTGRIRYTSLISSIANDYDRNKLILDICKKLQGYTIIVSERTSQLEYLENNLNNSVRIDSKMKKKDREKVVNDFRNGSYKYLLATYSLIAEGFDVPMLENIVMASPVKDERLVIQSVGRCQRPYNGKKYANVYDFYDDVGILYKAYRNRIKIYKREEWDIDD